MLSACGNTILQTKHCHNQGQKFQRRKPTCREVSSGGVQLILHVSEFLLVHAADTIRRCGPLSKLFVQPAARGPFPALFQVGCICKLSRAARGACAVRFLRPCPRDVSAGRTVCPCLAFSFVRQHGKFSGAAIRAYLIRLACALRCDKLSSQAIGPRCTRNGRRSKCPVFAGRGVR